jgi:hypothetical protein
VSGVAERLRSANAPLEASFGGVGHSAAWGDANVRERRAEISVGMFAFWEEATSRTLRR